MFNLLAYILCLCLLFLSYIIKSKYMKSVAICLSITFIIFLFYNSTSALDSGNYEFTFDNPIYLNEILFKWFTSLIKYTINDYKTYRGIIGGISLLPIVYISLKEGGKKCLCFVLGMYMIFPLFQNIVALRNTLASSIVLLGLYWLFKHKDSKKNYIFFTFIIILSAQIHTNMYLYLIVFLIYLLIIKTRIDYLKILFFILVIASFFRLDFVLSAISYLIPFRKSGYLTHVNLLGIGFVLTIIWQWIYFFLMKKSIKGLKMNNTIKESDLKIFNFNKSLLCIIPLYLLNVLFFRIIRNALIFEYIIIYKNEKSCFLHKRPILLMLLLLNVILLFVEASGYESLISILF